MQLLSVCITSWVTEGMFQNVLLFLTGMDTAGVTLVEDGIPWRQWMKHNITV